MSDNQCTYIDGIGSSQAIDTAGEIVDLAGIDCSSLIGGAFNWEHKSDIPAQTVGKILEYKKIFSDKDCENDRHKYYWEKCKTPYLYVMGRLFDDKKDSAKECAALFIDDSQHPDENPMVGFSIEGSKVDKQGIVVTKSIARRITVTGASANKQCIAELISAQDKKKDSDADSLFKSEPSVTIELFEEEKSMKKAEVPGSSIPSAHPAPTKSTPVNGAKGWNHTGGGNFQHPEHGHVSVIKEGDNFHVKHAGKLAGVGGEKGTFSNPKDAGAHAVKYMSGVSENKVSPNRLHSVSSAGMIKPKLNKAMTAGSGMAAPATLVGGAALGKESLDKKMKKGFEDKKNDPNAREGAMGMSMLARAEQEYKAWNKREEFESYMAKTMPNLTKGEIKALGQTLCLNKSLKAEKKLKKMMARPSMHSWLDKKQK